MWPARRGERDRKALFGAVKDAIHRKHPQIPQFAYSWDWRLFLPGELSVLSVPNSLTLTGNSDCGITLAKMAGALILCRVCSNGASG